MAKEIALEDGRTALFDDNATDAEIDQKLKSQNLKRQTAPAQPKEYASGGRAMWGGVKAVGCVAARLYEVAHDSNRGGA